MSFKLSRRNLSVLGIGAIIVISTIAIVFLNEEDSDPVDLGPGISDVLDEMVNYIGDLSANVSFEQEHFFKGDTIPFELKIQVDQSPARLN
ncbi:MAG: hypothetical protein ACW99A_04550, partial [Candidatus Kariarchaeaceae archaeon]